MSGRPTRSALSRLPGGSGTRRAVRRSVDAAVGRYRTALAADSRTLPLYLRAADAAGAARRVLRSDHVVDGLPDPAVPGVGVVGVSAAAEVSFVLTGATAWRHTIRGLEFRRGDERHHVRGLVQPVADVVRVLAPLPDDEPGWTLALLDADGEPLDLPVPELPGTVSGSVSGSA